MTRSATAAALAAVCATTAARPLYHADLWGHLAYGRWIWNHGTLPATEPLMAASGGERFVDFAWLAQVAGFLLYEAAGPEGLRLLGGVLVAATVGLIGTAAARRGGGVVGGWVAGAVFLAAAWTQLFAAPPWIDPLAPQMLRPQTLGVLLLAAVAAATPVPPRAGWRWAVLPGVFLVWANAHGGWPVGLAWLGLSAGDATLKRLRRGGARAAWRSRRVRAGLGLTAACAAAACVNPHGPAVVPELAAFARHPNLADVIEWRPMTLAQTQGRAFCVVAAVVVGLAARSRRVRVSKLVMLVGFGAAAWGSAGRWVLWWAVAAAVCAGRAVRAGGTATVRESAPVTPGAERADSLTVAVPLNVVAAGIFLGALLSPPAWRLAAGVTAGPGCLAAGTPVRAADALNRRGVRGVVFADHAFGDYLLFAAPDARPVVASHAHLVPPAVWGEARRAGAAGDRWEEVLDGWGVRALLLSPRRQGALTGAARASARWRAVWEGGGAVLFERTDWQPEARAEGFEVGLTGG